MCEAQPATTTYGLPVCQGCYDGLVGLQGDLEAMEAADPWLAELGRRVEESARKYLSERTNPPSPTSGQPRPDPARFQPPTVIHDEATATARRATRNINAEARGVEEGHTCRWDAQRSLFLVKSDTSERTYELTAAMGGLHADDRLLVVSCTCPFKRQLPAGILGCKHRTRVARRLERLGFARLGADGRWHVTQTLADLAATMEGDPC